MIDDSNYGRAELWLDQIGDNTPSDDERVLAIDTHALAIGYALLAIADKLAQIGGADDDQSRPW